MKILSRISQYIEDLDIFGVGINFRFSKQEQYKTKFGGIFTLAIFILMAYQIFLTVNYLVDYSSPAVLYEERYTQQAERYDLTPDKFSFAFGIMDSNSVHFIDPTIYSVVVNQRKILRTLDPTTGNYILSITRRPLLVETCTKDHFQLDAVKGYFLSQPYNQLFCLSLNQSDIYIEGQFDSLRHSGIEIYIQNCSGPSCQSPDAIQAKLSYNRLAVYYTDSIVIPSNKQNPFYYIGRQTVWTTVPQFAKFTNVFFRNSYLRTDVGLVNQDIKNSRTLTYSQDKEQLIPLEDDNIFYKCYLYHEKYLDNVYTRSYTKLDRAVSQVGGAFNVLFAIGCLFCRPLSKMALNYQLVNRIFKEEGRDRDNNNGSNVGEEEQQLNKRDNKSKIKNTYNASQIDYTPSPPIQYSESAPQDQQNEIQPFGASTVKLKLSQTPLSKSNQKNQQQKQSACSDNKLQQVQQGIQMKVYFEEVVKKMNEEKPAPKGFKYILHLIKQSGMCQFKKKQSTLSASVEALYNHIDVIYLVNKLLELEKLKSLLLNEDQIRLFEFIPKCDLTSNKSSSSKEYGTMAFRKNSKSQNQKATDALESLVRIVEKDGPISKIDQRLLAALDPKLKLLLQSNPDTTPTAGAGALNNSLNALQLIRSKIQRRLLMRQSGNNVSTIYSGDQNQEGNEILASLNIPQENENTEFNRVPSQARSSFEDSAGFNAYICRVQSPNQNNIFMIDNSQNVV